MPLSDAFKPFKSRLRKVTTSVLPALITMPLVPDTSTPARPAVPSIVIALVIVRAPNPPGSSVSISPAGAVFEMAPAKVLHGAVRLQGLASSPTPDTQVRVAWARATEALRKIADSTTLTRTIFIKGSLWIAWRQQSLRRGSVALA